MIDGSQFSADTYTRLLERKLVGGADRLTSPDLKAGPESATVTQAVVTKGSADNSTLENAQSVIAVAEQGAVSSKINLALNSDAKI